MQRFLRLTPVLFFILGVLFTPSLANAQTPSLSFSLSSSVLTGLPGSDISVSGTLTNNSGTELFLNSLQFAFDAPGSAFLTGNDSAFLANVPLSLAASGDGSTYQGVLFGLHIADNAPLMLPSDPAYTGSVSILGGESDTSTIELNRQNFQVRVAVPAPSSVLTLVMGAVPCIALMRRRRTRK